MGANCCFAAHSKSSHTVTSIEVAPHRNIQYSPSWSFRWDNKTHIEDIVENHVRFSHGHRDNAVSEIKSGLDTETEGLSDLGSPFRSLQPLRWQKSPSLKRMVTVTKVGETDAFIESNSSIEENELKSSIELGTSDSKSLIHGTLFSTARSDPSSSQSCALPSDRTSSRKARRLPSYQLSRQISDNRIPVHKSLNEGTSTEGRHSFVFPACSSDLSNGGSEGCSSDSWSMCMFSELVASSLRDRWSFDSENLSFCQNNLTGSNSQALVARPLDAQTCSICSKLLKERSSWKSFELSVVAVLFCGHMFHAECLENVTLEIDRFDPPCPICTDGGKGSSKLLKMTESKTKSKISRIAVADADADADLDGGSIGMGCRKSSKQGEKGTKMRVGSSTKNSFSKPFFRRLGSRTSLQSPSVKENTWKKGLWARCRRD